MAEATDFIRRLLERVLEDSHRHERGARGGWAMVSPLPLRRRIEDALAAGAGRAALSRRHFDPAAAAVVLAGFVERAEGLARTWDLLCDERSRELLLAVLSFRALGPRHVALPVAERNFRAACARIERGQRVEEDVARSPAGHPLHRYRVTGRGGPLSLLGTAFQVHEFFGLEQYALERGGVSIRVQPGDVVVDGGGGWGETALYFADATGPAGRVLSFEFVPANLALLRRNLALNPALDGRIEIVEHALWHRPGEAVAYAEDGAQSTLMAGEAGERASARTHSLDALCRSRGIERVDFLKLDVEGAELSALRGAEQTIRRSRPKLAVSIYHREEDFVDIPAWIEGLDLGYRLHLDHLWPGAAETILFALPGARASDRERPPPALESLPSR